MYETTPEKKAKIKQAVAVKKKNIKSTVKAKRAPANTVTQNRLELMVTVVNRNKTEFYADLIQSFDVNMQVIALAEGTADANTLRYLGLSNSDKSVIFSVIQENKLQDAMYVLGEKFKTVRGGNGIAFTIPFTSVIGTLLYGFLSNNKTIVKEEK